MLRLRKGFGSVRKLTGNRRNCYAVHPPTVKGVRPKALCYTDDYNIGVCVLNAWHNGKYYSGMELDLKERKLDEVVSTGSTGITSSERVRRRNCQNRAETGCILHG